MMTIQVLYFASLSEELKCQNEFITVEDGVEFSLKSLKEKLAERGDVWRRLLLSKSTRCSINQVIAYESAALKNRDEVAFFPPVTGG